MKRSKYLIFIVLTLLIANTSPLKADPPQPSASNQGIKTAAPVNEISFEDFRPQNIFSYNFGYWLSDTLTYKDFFFTNKSEWPLQIRSVAIAGPSFAAIHQCPPVVDTGYRCMIRMIFRPTDLGVQEGQMMIQTDRGPIVIALNGLGY